MNAQDRNIHFIFERGRVKSIQKISQGFTDETACKLFVTALRYAQRDGDTRLNAHFPYLERRRLERLNTLSQEFGQRAILGTDPQDTSFVSLETRLVCASDPQFRWLTVRSDEAQMLSDMVDWLPARVDMCSDGPRFTTLLKAMQPLVLGAMQDVLAENWQSVTYPRAA